jgi:tRNA(Ser,Leu) C12 N-acetylase TAN1
MLAKRLAEEIGKEYEFTLITVEPDGNIEANFYDDLKDVAQKMLEQIEEVVKGDLTEDLPEMTSYWEAIMITTEDNGKLYTVVENWNRWKVVHKIPAYKATLYITSDEILSTITGLKLYVRGKAVVTKGVTFYQVEIDRDQVKDLEAELRLLLGESI